MRSRLLVVQERLPAYRLPFFEELGRRFSLTVATEDHALWPDRKNFEVAPLGLRRRLANTPLRVVQASGVREMVHRLAPEAIVMSANPRFLFNDAIAEEARALGAQRLGWGLGTMDLTPGVPGVVRRVARRRLLRQFEDVLAYSTRGADEFVRLGFHPERVHVAFNSKWSRRGLPEERVAASRRVSVAYLGQLTGRKRVDVLLRAWAAVPSELRGAIIVIGEGPEREGLARLGRELGIEPDFTGHLEGRALIGALQRADLAVLPGTGGLALHDAFAAGLPVVCGRGDGTQFDLVTTDSGWILNDDSPASLGSLLTEIARSPLRLAPMGRNARGRVETTFNIENMADVFEAAIRA